MMEVQQQQMQQDVPQLLQPSGTQPLPFPTPNPQAGPSQGPTYTTQFVPATQLPRQFK